MSVSLSGVDKPIIRVTTSKWERFLDDRPIIDISYYIETAKVVDWQPEWENLNYVLVGSDFVVLD